MIVKGIKRRWLVNFLSLIVIILAVLALCFSFVVRGYYYRALEKSIIDRANNFSNIFNANRDVSYSDFYKYSQNYINGSIDSTSLSIVIFDSDDNIIEATNNFSNTDQKDSDFYIAKTSDDQLGKWVGRTSSGERVIAITKVIYNGYGSRLGSIRYIMPIKSVGSIMFFSVLFLLFVGIVIIFVVIAANLYFMKSILDPVGEIGAIAKRIAQGDFNARICKIYDDEIGELCDTINYMADELSTADKLKNDFISSVSHEIRTPLTAIKGWAETIQTGKVKNKQTTEKGMKIIVNEAERLSSIVEELLDFSSMQNKRMVIMKDKIDILAELDEAVYMFNERANSEGKSIIYTPPSSVPPIYGDKNRLRQVFINIIDNALKYTDVGGEIKIDMHEEGANIKVVVSDNGCGISKEHLPKVKEKFYKSNQSRRGSGIGLALADEIIALHSGELDIQSEEGVGTTVSIIIPINNPDNNQAII